MKYSSEKFRIEISIDDNSSSDFYQMKQKILQHLFRHEDKNVTFFYPFDIQQLITERCKRTGIKFGLSVYVADYEERQGSLEIVFLLIIESIVTFTHLRHFAEIIKEDIVTLFGHSEQFAINSEIRDIPNPRIEEHEAWNRRNRSTIKNLIIIITCLTISLLFFFFKLASEKDTTKPTEFILKTENGQPIIKALDNIIIYKDTLKLEKVDTHGKH